MNYSTAIFLINKGARAIKATYEADEKATRELFKTLDPTIKEGDLVVVETNTRHNMTVCKVVEVDVDFDIESSTPVRWIISKVDQAAYDSLKVHEDNAIKAIKSAELRRKREELAKSLLADNSSPEIQALAVIDAKPEVAKIEG